MNFRSCKLIKGLAVISTVWALSGCEVMQSVYERPTNMPLPEMSLCETDTQKDNFDKFCKSIYWLQFIAALQTMEWPERAKMIDTLNDETPSLVKKILLSQSEDTPYQQRLRAQNWVVKLNSGASDLMKVVLNDLIYSSSKQLLEFESAVIILSRVNARQEKTITELRLEVQETLQKLENREQEIEKQQDQVEQLLKIETDLLEQNRNEKR